MNEMMILSEIAVMSVRSKMRPAGFSDSNMIL
jgi:hypothetical protein